MRVSRTRLSLVKPQLSADDCAVIYARFSTKHQDPRSIDDQVRNCRRYIAGKKLTNILVLKDEAVSGSKDDRPGLEQLRSLAKKRPLLFRHVVIDDSSRLSRHNIDLQVLVFREFRSAGVVIHDVANNVRSDDEQAEMFWGFRGLIDSMYVGDMRKRVIRGMEGRALAGFSTGGRCYGYTTVPEEDPPDPKHPRRSIVVLEDEAKVVRSAFEMFRDGKGSHGIAATFNHERITPNRGANWTDGSIERLLTNERYTGKVFWRQTEWKRDPLTKKYKVTERPKGDWLVREDPALRIVPKGLWNAVQTLRAARGKLRLGRPLGSKNAIRPLTGLLYCGVCGGPLYITSGKAKNGKPYADYGCGARRRGGPSLCSNRRFISERKVRALVLHHMAKYLSTEKFDEWVEVGRQRHANMVQREDRDNREAVALAESIRTHEARIERVLEIAASGAGTSGVLKKKLAIEEEKLAGMRRKMAKLLAPPVRQVPTVDAEALRRTMEHLGDIFVAKPHEARAALRMLVRRITMFPTVRGVKFKISLQPSLIRPPAANSSRTVEIGG
jgi:site-specific DNA recombinase